MGRKNQRWKKSNCLRFVVFCFFLMTNQQGVIAASEKLSFVSPDEVQRLRLEGQRITSVDVRSLAEYQTKRIEGAVNIPYSAMQSSERIFLDEIASGATLPRNDAEKEGLLILYCSSEKCPLSESAATVLLGKGYTNVRVLAGGLESWEKGGYPVVGEAKKKDRGHGRLSAKDLRKKMKENGVMVLDIRPRAEFKAGHVPGARNIPLEELEKNLHQLNKEKDWVVCDRNAERRKKGVKLLAAQDFSVSEFHEDLAVWVARGYPLEVGVK